MPPWLVEALDDEVEEAKEKRTLPPNANRSDLIRIAAQMIVNDKEMDEEFRERALKYFQEEDS